MTLFHASWHDTRRVTVCLLLHSLVFGQDCLYTSTYGSRYDRPYLQLCTHTAVVYICVPTLIDLQLYTPAFNVVTFYFTETFPHCNCRSAVNDSAGGSFTHGSASSCMLVHWQHVRSSQLAGFRVEFSQFCTYLKPTV